jgi:hypothetical protein
VRELDFHMKMKSRFDYCDSRIERKKSMKRKREDEANSCRKE